jgi:hypothetical protein
MNTRSRYLDVAKYLLANRPLVLWVLSALKREYSEYDHVTRFVRRYGNLKSVLERVVKGDFPSDEELIALIPEFGDEPLYGEICHVLTNCGPSVPSALQRYPELITASDERFLETVGQLWKTWVEIRKKWDAQRSTFDPILARFLVRLDAATNHGTKSGSASTNNRLLKRYFGEMVHPFENPNMFWGIEVFCPRWYGCAYSDRFEGIEFVQYGENLKVAIRIRR